MTVRHLSPIRGQWKFVVFRMAKTTGACRALASVTPLTPALSPVRGEGVTANASSNSTNPFRAAALAWPDLAGEGRRERPMHDKRCWVSLSPQRGEGHGEGCDSSFGLSWRSLSATPAAKILLGRAFTLIEL